MSCIDVTIWHHATVHECTPALLMDNGLVILLRGRKLFGDAWCWEATAGCRQRHADGQPPAGAGQAAPHGLPFVVLHMPVCVLMDSHGLYVYKVTKGFKSIALLPTLPERSQKH